MSAVLFGSQFQQAKHLLRQRFLAAAGAAVSSVKFDYSGQYLAAGGADARIYGVKQDWQLLSTLSDLPQKVRRLFKRF